MRTPRFVAGVFLVALVGFGFRTAPGQTQPPSLAGEVLGAQCSAFPPSGFTCLSAGKGAVTTSCAPQANGTETVTFTVTNGVATGPYPGTFSESGTYTLGPAGSGGQGVGEQILAFSSTFSIQSSAGTVTGTKTGGAQGVGSHNFCAGFAGDPSTFAGAFASYDANIQTARGSFHFAGATLGQVSSGRPSDPTSGFFENYGGSRTQPQSAPAKIAFASNRSGNFEIYSMNADGSGQTRLTHNPALDVAPAFSADGTKIAFESTRTGNGDIYVMNANGSGVKQLTSGPSIDGTQAFSPDGTKIAFSSFRTGNGDIYVMNTDGGGLRRLTKSPYLDSEPSWSPDGKRILFTSGRAGNGEIYVMNANGSAQRRLTASIAIDSSPDWSLDGTKIVFASNRDGNFEIYAMNADGTGQTRLTNTPAYDGEPTFVSNGKVAFTTKRGDNFEIYSMNVDGTGLTRLTTNPAVDVSPGAP